MLEDQLAKIGGGGKRTTPLWKGPEEDGVTFSLLSRFLVCRERFRMYAVEGWKPADTFNHRIEYGQMWHWCEEAMSKKPRQDSREWSDGRYESWVQVLREYTEELCRKYPLKQKEIFHWGQVCATQFLLYLRYWSRNDTRDVRETLLSEEVFSVPYKLPSGRVVKLRGKWDSVFLSGKGKERGVWLFEHKTKGDIRPQQLQRQLTFDLQTMLYLVALGEKQDSSFWNRSNKMWRSLPIEGVLYNVVRRPLSGGKGTIVKHKPTKKNPLGESDEEFYARLGEYIKTEPETYFMRWKVEVTEKDVERFKRECFNPILEQLCWWWEEVTAGPDDTPGQYHDFHSPPPASWRHPFGVWNILDDGGSSELDEYLATGSTVGLRQATDLFPELK